MPTVWANITPPWILFAYPSDESEECDIGEILGSFMHKEDAERFAEWYPLMNGREWSIEQHGVRQSWSPDTEDLTRYVFTTYPHRINSVPDNEHLRELEIDIVTNGIGTIDHEHVPDTTFAWLPDPPSTPNSTPCLFFRIFAPTRQQALYLYAHQLRSIATNGGVMNLYGNNLEIAGHVYWPANGQKHIVHVRTTAEEENPDAQ